MKDRRDYWRAEPGRVGPAHRFGCGGKLDSHQRVFADAEERIADDTATPDGTQNG